MALMYKRENQNYYRLAYTVFNVVVDALRNVFRREWDELYRTAPWTDDNRSLTNFIQEEKRREVALKNTNFKGYSLLPRTDGDRAKMDMTVVSSMLLYTNSLELKTRKRALWNDIDSLRRVRNELAHKLKPSFTDQEYNDLFDQIETAVAGLNLPSYTDSVKECRNSSRMTTNKEIVFINRGLTYSVKAHNFLCNMFALSTLITMFTLAVTIR